MNQHDSQELLSRLLDGLHEDLNIIQKKPYIEDKDCTDKDDGPQVAKTYWTNFLRRNYSKIIQSFYGQFRSQIKCPECEHVSVRYDPFELVSLPVPRYEVMEYRFSGFQISKNQDKQAKKVSFTVKADNKHIPKVATVMEEFAKAMADGQPGNRYIMCFSGFSVHGDDIPLSSTVADVHNKNRDTFYRPKIFVFEKTDEEMAIEQKPDSMHILCLSKLLERENDRYASPEHPSFAKMVWGAEETTVEELYYRIFVKFAHFINTQELGIETKKKEDDSRELAPYPAFVEDYQKLFKECMGNQKFNHKFLFRIKWGGEYLQYDSKQTLGELIKSAGSFAKDSGEVEHWNNASRLLKLDVWLDPVIKEYVSIDYMKKIQSDEIDVVFDSVQKDEEEGKKHNIHSLIKKFCEPEVLDDHNLYNCSQCKKRVNGLKQVNIYKAPKYLILHMKKLKDNYGFRWSSSSSNDHLMVDFEVDNFDLTPHLLDKEPISCYNIPKEDFMDKGNRRLEDRIIPEFTWTKDSMVYDCFGVINHYGSMHFGHYTAFAKNNGQWYCYDDSTVTKVDDPRSIVTTAAYVVFYERRD